MPAGAAVGLSLRQAAEIAELTETEALASASAAAPRALAKRLGLSALRLGSAVAVRALECDVPMLNRVVGLGIGVPITEEVVEAIETFYKDAPVRCLVQVSPAVSAPEQELLRTRLEARGLVRHDNWAKLVRGVEPAPEARTSLRIRPAGPEHAGAIAAILNEAFGTPDLFGQLLAGLAGRPGWRHYLAWDGGEPVAIGALFVHGRAGAFEGAATLPGYRGRGAQSALMARRVADAAALGCRWLVSETGEETPDRPNPSYRNMLRAGFRLLYQRPNWVHFPSR